MSVPIRETAQPEELIVAVNRSLAGVPHCYPTDPGELAGALQGRHAGHIAAQLGEDRIWLAGSPAEPVGMLHLAIERSDAGDRPRGAIRFFWFAPGNEDMGRALLAHAEHSLRASAIGQVVAWHYDHTYPFYHAEHAYLTGHLSHVHHILRASGYQESGCEVVLDWRNYDSEAPRPLTRSIRLTYQWEQGRADRPGLTLLAHADRDEVGTCVCVSQSEFTAAPEAREWVYTRWLGVTKDGAAGVWAAF
jgi:hypothetical protein